MKLFGLALSLLLASPLVAGAQHDHPAGQLGSVNFETSCAPATRP